MAALDLLSRRWSLRVLWELRDGPLTFRGIREACGGVSPSVLNTRLAELKEVGVVETTASGYALTGSGRDLREALVPLWKWSRDWERQQT